MTFEWDPVKAAVNERKHGVSFYEAATVFVDPLAMTFHDPDHSDDEAREITIGYTLRKKILFVSHVSRRGRIRLISARLATKAERDGYEEGDST